MKADIHPNQILQVAAGLAKDQFAKLGLHGMGKTGAQALQARRRNQECLDEIAGAAVYLTVRLYMESLAALAPPSPQAELPLPGPALPEAPPPTGNVVPLKKEEKEEAKPEAG